MFKRILYTGFAAGMSGAIKSKLYRSNLTALVVSILSLAFAVASAVKFTPGLVPAVIALIVVGVAFVLNRLAYYQLSRPLLSISPLVLTVWLCVLFLQNGYIVSSYFWGMCLSFLLIPLVVFDRQEAGWTMAVVAVDVALLLLSAPVLQGATDVMPHQPAILWFDFLAVISSFATLGFCGFWMLYEIRRREKMISGLRHQVRYLQDEVESTQAQLIQSEKMIFLGQMTAGIAHEVNNPLNYISGGVEALRYSVDDCLHLARHPEEVKPGMLEELETDARNLLTSISNGVHRAHKIITSLRNFSSPQAYYSHIAVAEVLEIAVTIMSSKLKSGNIQLVKDYAPEDPQEVYGCVPELSQVVINILDNAIYALQESRREDKVIHVGLTRAGQGVTISIADNGPGIPENIRPKLFRAFFTTKQEGKGTGLGLSISASIIQKHQGSLDFSSTLGEGTTFLVNLKVPAAVVAETVPA